MMYTRYRRDARLISFNDTATTEIYTLALHDALPIFEGDHLPLTETRDESLGMTDGELRVSHADVVHRVGDDVSLGVDRKSTRLNSSHANISYAVFCLEKKSTRMHSIHATI